MHNKFADFLKNYNDVSFTQKKVMVFVEDHYPFFMPNSGGPYEIGEVIHSAVQNAVNILIGKKAIPVSKATEQHSEEQLLDQLRLELTKAFKNTSKIAPNAEFCDSDVVEYFVAGVYKPLAEKANEVFKKCEYK